MSDIIRRFNGKGLQKEKYAVITGGILLGVGILSAIRSILNDYKEKRDFAVLIDRKKSATRAQHCTLRKKYLEKPEKYDKILSLTLDELINLLQSRQLTATEVLDVYTAKALEATEEFNCVTEFLPDAFKIAKELDESGEIKGILHGVPFCVKDDTNVQGVDSTLGCSRNLFKPAKDSAVVVQILQDLGGIPFCHTNLPQTCLSFSSENPIFGKTVNPLNKALTPGGSSSGTGALVCCGGTPFGLGSDTGGSAKVPAHFCGIATLRPSKNRVSRRGCLQCMEHCVGHATIPCVMARKAKDVAFLFKVTTQNNMQNIYDGKAVPISWNTDMFESKRNLRIGYFTSLSDFPPVGDVAETVEKAKSKLEELGHTMVPFEINNCSQIRKVIFQLSRADMGKHLMNLIRNDQKSPEMKKIWKLNNVSHSMHKLYTVLPSWLTGQDPEFHKACLALEYSTDLWDCMGERKDIIENLLEDLKEKEIDIIVCPAVPFAAVGVDDLWKIRIPVYSFMWNLFDFPAGVVKAGVESGKNFDSFNDQGSSSKKHFKQSIKKSIGMPIGVQIVGKPFHEEMVLRVMVELENSLKDATLG